MSLRTRYKPETYWDGWETLEELPQGICGIRMKDGTENWCMPSTQGYEDQEKLIYFIESTMFDAILDISQVETPMFHRGWENDASNNPTIETFYYIPIQ